MKAKLKHTVKTHLAEETYNNLITILEDLNQSAEEFIREAIKEKIDKTLERYRMYCH